MASQEASDKHSLEQHHTILRPGSAFQLLERQGIDALPNITTLLNLAKFIGFWVWIHLQIELLHHLQGNIVTPRIPARPDWRIRTGFRDARLRIGTLYLIFFFFFLKPIGTCGYGPHLLAESKELPPEWCPSKSIHI